MYNIMDIIHFLKSYGLLYPNLKKNFNINKIFELDIKKVFEEPNNVIENIFVGNIFNSSNYCVIRDYNFKLVINISNNLDNYLENSDLIYEYVKLDIDVDENFMDNFDNLNNPNNPNNSNNPNNPNIIEDTIDKIILFQSRTNSKSLLNDNILIYSDKNEKISLFLLNVLKKKYNLSKNKILKLLEKVGLL